MKVLVCGGRDFADWESFKRAMDSLHAQRGITCVVHGAHWNENKGAIKAASADWFAEIWARRNQVKFIGIPAEWNKHNKAAGPIRNKRMLDEERPDGVVAFPGGNGTADMIRQAKESGIKVWEPIKG